MRRDIIRMAVCLFAGAVSHLGLAEPIPETTVSGTRWRIESATKFPKRAVVASGRKEEILVWERGDSADVASTVQLRVDAPFEQVQPAVQQALKRLGGFKFEADTRSFELHSSLYNHSDYVPAVWDKVLLSHRADLRDELANRSLPRLQQMVEQGAILPAEMEHLFALERVNVNTGSNSHIQFKSFDNRYPQWFATRKKSYGLTGSRDSETVIWLIDATAMFGQPTTIIDIKGRATYPNPEYSSWREWKKLILFEWCIICVGGGGPLPYSRDYIVPASVFIALRDALAGLPGKVEIADLPLAWVQPVEPPKVAPELMLTAPDADAPLIEAEVFRLDTRVFGLLTLPGGDLVFSTEARDDDKDHPYRVWRFHETAGVWQPKEVWRGAGVGKLLLSADGHTVWFVGRTAESKTYDLISCDVETRKITRRRVTWSRADKDDALPHGWMLAGDQLPAILDRHDRLEHNDIGSRDAIAVLRPTTPPTAEHEPWVFERTFASARRSIMGTHTLVRWRDTKAFWTKDSHGIAELDAESGRVMRAWATPRPGGGSIWHVPQPIGSPEANWIATGFIFGYRTLDDERIPPALRPIPGDRNDEPFVGMHVINLKDGHVLSALLGRFRTLQAAARSANGRFLALGSSDMYGSGSRNQVVLWDIKQGHTPVRLDTSKIQGEMSGLAFSWDGAELWAIVSGKLYRWRLPEPLRDAATNGSFPDQ